MPDSSSPLPDVPAPTPGPRGRRRRFTPLLLIAGLASAIVLSLSMTNTFSAFTAAITNSTNTAASGTLILQETGTNPTTTCNSNDPGTGTPANSINTNASVCLINKYGGSTTLVPSTGTPASTTSVTTVNFKNTGTATAIGFSLAGGACVQSNNGTINGSATDFCAKLRVIITSAGTPVASTTAAALATTPVSLNAFIPAASGATTVPFTFTVYLDSTAGNTYQGLTATQPLIWTLTT